MSNKNIYIFFQILQNFIVSIQFFADMQFEFQTINISDETPHLWGIIWIQIVFKGHQLS